MDLPSGRVRCRETSRDQAMTDLRTAAQLALKSMEKATRFMSDSDYKKLNHAIEVLKDALAVPEEDPELSAALGWVGGISEPVLDRKALLRRVAEIAQDMQAKTKREWDVGYDRGLKAASERRLNDAEIGEVWFEAKIPGLTETQARLLIRAAERRLLEGKQ